MGKQNCWEYKGCGREPGGSKESELGACPAATSTLHEGKNGGRAAGRFCWKVAGTFCGGKPQGTFVDKMFGCARCDFFQNVKDVEAAAFEA